VNGSVPCPTGWPCHCWGWCTEREPGGEAARGNPWAVGPCEGHSEIPAPGAHRGLGGGGEGGKRGIGRVVTGGGGSGQKRRRAPGELTGPQGWGLAEAGAENRCGTGLGELSCRPPVTTPSY